MKNTVKIIGANTNRVTDALCNAAGFSYSTKHIHCTPRDGRAYCHSFRDEFFCQGHHFKNRKALNEWMVSEVNDWMSDNGLVDWSVLENAHNSHGSCYKLFSID
jgi:hypothetical protein